jgi:hypothetical protein
MAINLKKFWVKFFRIILVIAGWLWFLYCVLVSVILLLWNTKFSNIDNMFTAVVVAVVVMGLGIIGLIPCYTFWVKKKLKLEKFIE